MLIEVTRFLFLVEICIQPWL